jgi:hypothetical protein
VPRWLGWKRQVSRSILKDSHHEEDNQLNSTFWVFVVVTAGFVIVIATLGLAYMGVRAYTSGSAPGAPEAFTAFASHVLRIATVIAIVGTTLTLAVLKIELTSAITGILSGIAGYVLGGAEKAPKLLTRSQKQPPA